VDPHARATLSTAQARRRSAVDRRRRVLSILLMEVSFVHFRRMSDFKNSAAH
jgi:hypothetical protein